MEARAPRALPVDFARPLREPSTPEPRLYALNEHAMVRWLRRLAAAPVVGEAFIAAVRLFASAIEVMRTRPDVAYVLLVSSVEAMALVTLDRWQPPAAVRRQTREPMLKEARRQGLTASATRRLVDASLKGNDWLRRKFVEYLLRGTAGSSVPHPASPLEMPAPADYETVFGSIYEARSKSVHSGKDMPVTIDAMMDGWLTVRASQELLGRALDGRWRPGEVPSVAWFANVVRVAHERWVLTKLHLRVPPIMQVSEVSRGLPGDGGTEPG